MQSVGGILWIVIIMVLSDAVDRWRGGGGTCARVPGTSAPHMSPSHCWGTVGGDADSATGHMATLFVENIELTFTEHCISIKII